MRWLGVRSWVPIVVLGVLGLGAIYAYLLGWEYVSLVAAIAALGWMVTVEAYRGIRSRGECWYCGRRRVTNRAGLCSTCARVG